MRRNEESTAPAHTHPQHALIPAGDDLTRTQTERQRLAAVPTGVEFLSGGVRNTHVVHLDGAAVSGLLPFTDLDVGDLQVGRWRTFDEVDLGTLERHVHPWLSALRRWGAKAIALRALVN